MGYDEKADKIDWKDEYVWVVISLLSGITLSLLFIFFDRFPETNHVAVISITCIVFYIFGILLRIQNHRGKILTAKTAVNEKYLKYIFAIAGFGIGLALLFL